ncbi:glycoside hydrolase family 18 protein [Catelliglobosispora koreensis]|uniref:glycoside hydrolase family 18 protein n=1 Tax=Catelliglobosispora koreensis TaxID=129052 RepID=UPI0003652202|nr:glycoside hydrolase family 18 protein [Catelliglobosispora koreensis]
MRLRPLIALLAAATAVAAAGIAAPAAQAASSGSTRPKLRQVGYFTQWGIYGRNFHVKDLDTSGAAAKLTHINYAFANVSPEGLCFQSATPGESDAWADYQRTVPAEQSVDGVGDTWGEPLNGNFGQLLKLKQKHPNLKVMISIGGWTWSTYFSNAALPENRAAFVSSCIDIFLKGNLPILDGGSGGPGAAAGVFDGIDLDWEWPNWNGEPGNVIRPEDKVNFTGLVAEFRKQLDALGQSNAKKYELSAFLPANPAAMDAGFEGKKIFKYLDFATVQGYDFHGTWETVTNQQSALRRPAGSPDNPDFTLERTVKSWIERGAPRQKIVIGIPYYGQGWTGITAGGNGLFKPATGPAPATHQAGFEDYKALKTLGYPVYRDWQAGHAWLFNGTTFWTYDDPLVVLQKTLWSRSQGLGGVMVWSLDGDDSNATLTKTIHLGLS